MRHNYPELRRRIRDLEAENRRLRSRDPLASNDVVIRAAELAVQLIMIKLHTRIERSGLGDPEYLRKFMPLALDPTISNKEAAARLGVSDKAYARHLGAVNSYLGRFLDEAHELRDAGVGFGWVKSYDIEEQRELFDEPKRSSDGGT